MSIFILVNRLCHSCVDVHSYRSLTNVASSTAQNSQFVLFFLGEIPDNRGTEFVIGYMANDDDDNELQLFVTTSKTTQVSVQVTAPRFKTSKYTTTYV